ncbi:carbohydrate sulfotransferase 1-like [Liolophura sinensis]|uniref:carbohydrate sulfotransferase 1-like n=1 Tax=Liolophura sinensis TaxID=3198878 RepID=UPI0031587F9C
MSDALLKTPIRQPGFPDTPPMTVRSHDAHSNQSRKVLVFAYFRSGSTFTSATLSRLNGSFFAFEPLHVLYEFLMETHRVLDFMNGKIQPPLVQGFEGAYKVSLIQALLTCDLYNVDISTLLLGFLPKFSWQIQHFQECIRNAPGSRDSKYSSSCVDSLKQMCISAPVRIVKTIRLSMETVGRMLDDIPDLKVIHLIRDPRGQFGSGARHSKRNVQLFQHKVCNKVTNDVKTRLELEQRHPNSFLEVIYEDLAHNPQHTVQKMYDFLGLTLPPYVIQWIKESTSAETDDNGYLATKRSNSTEAAYRWLSYVPWNYVVFFQTRCTWLLKHGNFPFFEKKEDMKQFVIPCRPLVR